MIDETIAEEFPETLRIGFADWDVTVCPHGTLKDEDGDEAFGLCEKGNLEIKIDEFQPDAHMTNTFFHEIIHAIYYAHGLPDRVDEETVATSLANGFMALFRDNPDFQVWVVNHLCKDVE